MVVPAPRDDRLAGRDGDRKNFLIDASILDTYPLQALVPTIIATLVRFTSDENEVGGIVILSRPTPKGWTERKIVPGSLKDIETERH